MKASLASTVRTSAIVQKETLVTKSMVFAVMAVVIQTGQDQDVRHVSYSKY